MALNGVKRRETASPLPPTRENTYDAGHTQGRHGKTRTNRSPGPSMGLCHSQGKHVKTRIWEPSDGVKRPPTRKNTYDSEHLQENHVKTRLWGYPGASSGLLGPPGGHPGASPGLLKVSCCLRRPPARENTSPQRYFVRFLRIFTSSWVYVSVSRGPRHVKTRPSRM